MGKKRQRSAAQAGEGAHSASQKPSQQPPQNAAGSVAEPSKKKHKKAPLQLKMIVMKGATTESVKKQSEAPSPAASQLKPEQSTTEGESSKKAKKKKKNKNKSKSEDTSASAAESKTAKPSTADIDDLFKSLKTKKQENALAAEREANEAARAKKEARKERERLDEQIKLLEAQNTNQTAMQGKNPDPRPLRYDEDGLPIYSEESLQINKGGDTADCPFDCWCCF